MCVLSFMLHRPCMKDVHSSCDSVLFPCSSFYQRRTCPSSSAYDSRYHHSSLPPFWYALSAAGMLDLLLAAHFNITSFNPEEGCKDNICHQVKRFCTKESDDKTGWECPAVFIFPITAHEMCGPDCWMP
eukprot:gb/GEZN01013662.1/.p2 GENE.gb/GEZN01013662.1/~~gb/GEZN01013662.1/.p2  ORF type:complete len:139 (-),score=15.07 gb/GEZN01013662.1/:584-970(-)